MTKLSCIFIDKLNVWAGSWERKQPKDLKIVRGLFKAESFHAGSAEQRGVRTFQSISDYYRQAQRYCTLPFKNIKSDEFSLIAT